MGVSNMLALRKKMLRCCDAHIHCIYKFYKIFTSETTRQKNPKHGPHPPSKPTVLIRILMPAP